MCLMSLALWRLRGEDGQPSAPCSHSPRMRSCVHKTDKCPSAVQCKHRVASSSSISWTQLSSCPINVSPCKSYKSYRPHGLLVVSPLQARGRKCCEPLTHDGGYQDPEATGRRCCQRLRAQFSPVAHSGLWVSPPPSWDLYSTGSMQWQPADQSQRTLGGREGKQEAGGRQGDRGNCIK